MVRRETCDQVPVPKCLLHKGNSYEIFVSIDVISEDDEKFKSKCIFTAASY